MSILHIATDEKFVNSAIYLFEKAFPQCNFFRIVVPNENYELIHAKKTENMDFWYSDSYSNRLLKNQIMGYNVIVFHNIDYFKSMIINELLSREHDVKVFWMFWGGEVYNNRFLKNNNRIGKLTEKRFVKTSLLKKIKAWLVPLYLLGQRNHPHKAILKSIKRVDLVGSFKEDFEFLKQNKLLNEKAKQVMFTYSPIEFVFKNNHDLNINGDNILLGNSATITNNHLEAFEKLKKLNLNNRKIIAPLNYGDINYAKDISKIGNAEFGGNFLPLLEFMELSVYNNYISQCGITVMNHYRQQAVGNVLSMLWMGSKVYLSDLSTVYSYLKRIGIEIYSIEKDLVPDNDQCLQLLTHLSVNRNRTILLNEIGEKKIIQSLVDNLKEVK